MKESKKRRRKQPGKLKANSCSQPVNLPGARSLMNLLSTNDSKSRTQTLMSGQFPVCTITASQFTCKTAFWQTGNIAWYYNIMSQNIMSGIVLLQQRKPNSLTFGWRMESNQNWKRPEFSWRPRLPIQVSQTGWKYYYCTIQLRSHEKSKLYTRVVQKVKLKLVGPPA